MRALEFTGSGGEYFKIWIVNVLLTVATLGLYYPWAKVRNRRYFYGNSLLEDRNFEYHATGKQIFFGYLVAMILLIAYVVLEQVFPILSLALIGLFLLALPWIIVRSMMFNMKMTSFSNVHFSFSGTFKNAYMNFLLYPVALYIGFIIIYVVMSMVFMKLGSIGTVIGMLLLIAMFAYGIFGFSFIKKKNSEFFINNLSYGQGEFEVDLTIKELAKITLKVMGVAMLCLFGIFFLVGLVGYLAIGLETIAQLGNDLQDSEILQDPEATKEKLSILLPLLGAVYIGFIISMIGIMAYSISLHRAYIYENTKLDEQVNFVSTLKPLSYAWILISNFILVIFTLGFAMPWAKVRVARVMLENTLVDSPEGFDKYISKEQSRTSPLGDQIGEAFDVDIGLGF